MPINVGYIEATVDGVIARVYYDPAFEPVGDGQPLIDGPRGYCLDLTNPTGRLVKLRVQLPGGQETTINVGSGDPVTGGPPSGRSRTRVQMGALGFLTRGDVASVQIGY